MHIDITLNTPEHSFLAFDAYGKSFSFKKYQKGIEKIKKNIEALSVDERASYQISDYLICDDIQHHCSFIINLNTKLMTEKQINKIKCLIEEHLFDTIAYRNKLLSIRIIQKFENDTLHIGIVFL